MPPGHGTTPDFPVRFTVTVTDLAAVQRVLALLTGRRYPLARFAADAAGDGCWRVALDLTADADSIGLLGARLHRLPSVLAVDVAAAPALAPTG